MFIELTRQDDQEFYVNINHIESVAINDDGYTIIIFPIITPDAYNYIYVSESYEKVKQLIADEVAAERGY